MKLSKQKLKEIIKDELKSNNKQKLLEYTLDKDDIHVIKDIIRDEVAEILRDLWKKKNIWA